MVTGHQLPYPKLLSRSGSGVTDDQADDSTWDLSSSEQKDQSATTATFIVYDNVSHIVNTYYSPGTCAEPNVHRHVDVADQIAAPSTIPDAPCHSRASCLIAIKYGLSDQKEAHCPTVGRMGPGQTTGHIVESAIPCMTLGAREYDAEKRQST